MELNSGVVRARRIGDPPRVEGSLPEATLSEGSWKGTACHSDLASMRGAQTRGHYALRKPDYALSETLALKDRLRAVACRPALGSPILGGSFGSSSVALFFARV